MSGHTLRFTKMHGCGNDYVYFDCFHQEIGDPEALSIRLSDRHKGVGGDGIILVCPSDVADGKMRIFNADGSEAMMCGNGIRCVAKFLYDTGLCRKKHLEIDTLSGVKYCDIIEQDGEAGAVTVDMGQAELEPGKIPVNLPGESVIGRRVSVAGGEYAVTCVSMGNPHCVVFGGDPMELDLEELGPKFENDPLFPDRVNTEFIQVLDSHTLSMRVWERGSGETMACGTGACAAAVAACLNGFCWVGEDITVKLRGGDLVINYTPERVTMTGEAVRVFDGAVEA
ncbi:diaminopimelate epimerase [Acutalibacter sp. 1XD8-33]|uniref:diaminopimelate epimerase n=1 Tax=Acutalibacter sp. 1XD8-33 TaxID=2320081 RepID=UPI000EA1DDC8|nr:diaminopimelate epimerase [Acutalibacter sp. 1XD8-33]RKJ42126.1 diaminopimelate epimerase [Acutalibacter sp. 1XD8-33]